MATLRDIRRRIKGIQSTQQITKAMKMVAAAKLRRAQENILNARPFARKINSMLNHLITDEDRINNPFLYEREVKNIALVVVTADRGLCGAFNTNILRDAVKFVADETEKGPNVNVRLYCVGKKGNDFFSKRNYNLLGKSTGIFSSLKVESALKIYEEVVEKFLSGEVDKIILLYNEFKSVIQQRIITEQYLPVPTLQETADDREKINLQNFIFEPSQKLIFHSLLPKHLKAQMWRVLLESNAAELGARMTAMDNATENAKELIRSLRLTFNKERQAAITKEILEIVSGANALKGSS